jgi:hypothetical protein
MRRIDSVERDIYLSSNNHLPNPKVQTNIHHQSPNAKQFGYCNVVIGSCLVFGIWSLVITWFSNASTAWYELRTKGPAVTQEKPARLASASYAWNRDGLTYSITGK